MSEAVAPEIEWSPQVGPQAIAISSGACVDEALYGGAVFAGKSDFLLGDFASDVWQGDKWIGVLFRRHVTDMDDLIARSHQIYGAMGADWKEGKKEWHFPGGSVLRMRHMDTDNDFAKYMGWSLSWIGFDELPTWETMRPYNMMKSRLRGPAINKRMRSSGNPGGRCHNEVKEYFGIDKFPGFTPLRDPKSKMVRCFMPGKAEDNKIGLAGDPEYLDRLEGLGDPALVKMWKQGDWSISFGSFYECTAQQLMVKPFLIPETWPLFLSMDYGESHPTAGALMAVDFDYDVWVINSYYGSGAAADHARGLLAMVGQCPWTEGRGTNLNLAPSDMKTKRSPGEASQARAPIDTFTELGLPLAMANMDRVNGARNLGNLINTNRIHFFSGYTEPLVRSIVGLQRNPNNPEDVLKASGDDGYDCVRYGVNHVFKPRPTAPKASKAVGTGGAVLDQIKNEHKGTGRYK